MALMAPASRSSSSAPAPGWATGTRALRSPRAMRWAVASVAARGWDSEAASAAATATLTSAVATPATTNHRPAAPRPSSMVSTSTTAWPSGAPSRAGRGTAA
jgi:hypothetical protein